LRISSRQIVEGIGAAAIVASLVFVGMQLKLDRNVALAAQYAARSESLRQDLRTQMESDGFIASSIRVWELGQRPSYWSEDLEEYSQSKNFTNADITYLLISARIRVLHMDNLYYQYKKDMFDESFWVKQVASMKNDMRDPVYKALYLNNPRGIEGLLNELVLELENE
jgi:hypothetical protein|tara:strand:+ start:45235 stop:45738 length:504 start_codon:yes stop_codon:yes gene_type:complete